MTDKSSKADNPQKIFVSFYPRDFFRFFGLFWFLAFVQMIGFDDGRAIEIEVREKT